MKIDTGNSHLRSEHVNTRVHFQCLYGKSLLDYRTNFKSQPPWLSVGRETVGHIDCLTQISLYNVGHLTRCRTNCDRKPHCNFTPFSGSWTCNVLTALKAMFRSIVLNGRITTTIIILKFIIGAKWGPSRFNRKVSAYLHQRGVNLRGLSQQIVDFCYNARLLTRNSMFFMMWTFSRQNYDFKIRVMSYDK